MEPPHPPQTTDVSRIHPIEHISHLLSASTTGIGKTLEDLLDIQENNYQEPDFGEYELKASRSNSNSMLTLFTKSPLPKGANTRLRLMYGYASSAHDNNTDNIWSCFRCGGEAVSLNDFGIDHDPNDLVFEVEGPDDFILNWKNIGKFFYLALYASYGEAEEGNLTVGYSVYDKDRKLLDGGDYEYPQEVDTDTVADRFDEVMDFIFWDGMMESEEAVKLKIRVSDLERDDFDD